MLADSLIVVGLDDTTAGIEHSRGVKREQVPGSGVRPMLVATAIGGGLALASTLPQEIHAWHT